MVANSVSTELEELRRDLVAASYLRGAFTLGSLGQTSFYFDKYLFATKPSILRRLATSLAHALDDTIDRIAGTELGGVALAAAVSLESGLPFVVIRREPRGRRMHEGELSPGDRVALIEDVVATGHHALTSVTRLREQDAVVQDVVAVIDRDEGAAALLEKAGCRLQALFVIGDDNIPG